MVFGANGRAGNADEDEDMLCEVGESTVEDIEAEELLAGVEDEESAEEVAATELRLVLDVVATCVADF